MDGAEPGAVLSILLNSRIKIKPRLKHTHIHTTAFMGPKSLKFLLLISHLTIFWENLM